MPSPAARPSCPPRNARCCRRSTTPRASA
jgi:hypothetical protein